MIFFIYKEVGIVYTDVGNFAFENVCALQI